MTEKSSKRLRMLWLLPPIIVGLVVFVLLKGSQQEPEVVDAGEPQRTVRSMQIEAVDFVPIARGYGTVAPARVWKAIAEVSGRIISMNANLSDGALIEQGKTLVMIDPADYELALAQAQTTLTELGVEERNTKSSLAIERRNLELAEKEVERLQRLLKQGSISQSNVDSAERTMLSSRALVQNLENTLALMPSRKKLQQSKITLARRDLENTKIIAPFNLRVSGLDIQTDQYVSKGQHLVSGDSVDQVEIIAQVSLASLKNLFSESRAMQINITSITHNLNDLTGFKPTVQMDIGNSEPARWDARFIRFSDRVDSQTRTMGLVVAVDNPLQKVIPGRRPPLSKGMLVEVQIAGRTQPDRLVIPRAAIRGGKVYLADADNRLRIEPVHLLYEQDEFAVVDSGLSAGDRLVLTDVVPALEGLLLKLVDTGAAPVSDG